MARRELLQARQAQGQEVAALGGPEAWTSSMITQLEVLEIRRAPSQAQNRASCSGVVSRMSGGLTRWRWRRATPRVAGAGLRLDRQVHLGDRRRQIALDVHRQGLERRDVEGVHARAAYWRGGRSARSIRLGRKPARVLPPPVGAISRAWRPSRAFCTMAS